jgi:hypothetical protein
MAPKFDFGMISSVGMGCSEGSFEDDFFRVVGGSR